MTMKRTGYYCPFCGVVGLIDCDDEDLYLGRRHVCLACENEVHNLPKWKQETSHWWDRNINAAGVQTDG